MSDYRRHFVPGGMYIFSVVGERPGLQLSARLASLVIPSLGVP